ncbi:odorant receptor 4-like [Amyelois transitella]|uniref:odorant receptor 4-like n=1 Tax=Amyelois transitella TaxID=680683 RepID=UPI00067CF9BF|nr:odorant receptor 4-like [Amyelois transitella]
MERISQESALFEKSLDRVNKVLRILGMSLDEKDLDRSYGEILRHRLFFCFNCLWFNNDVILEVAWLIDSLLIGRSVIEITYFLPCLTLCILGDLKTFYFIKHGNEVNDLVKTLRKLQAVSDKVRVFRDEVEEEMIKQMPKLNFATYSLWCSNAFGLITFAVGPFVLTAMEYQETGVIKLGLPFLVWYPFDPSDIRIWPFTYIHQLWSAVNAIFTVIGPDNYFSMSCTFIHVQFLKLQYDIERITTSKADPKNKTKDKLFSAQILQIIERHKELIRCVQLLETIYSKSTLFNVATSSLLICISGFNVTTIDNYILMVPFFGFLSMGLFQIYVLCYYGDLLMQSSLDIGDAIYKSQWYVANASDMKDMLFISMRSRRPCKLTAYGFAEINLHTYYRIMGTAWSYFALLKTVYK